MATFGLFNDEGVVEDGFTTADEAQQALANYSDEDELTVEELCPDHPGHAKCGCEQCDEEETTEANDPGDDDGDDDDES